MGIPEHRFMEFMCWFWVVFGWVNGWSPGGSKHVGGWVWGRESLSSFMSQNPVGVKPSAPFSGGGGGNPSPTPRPIFPLLLVKFSLAPLVPNGFFLFNVRWWMVGRGLTPLVQEDFARGGQTQVGSQTIFSESAKIVFPKQYYLNFLPHFPTQPQKCQEGFLLNFYKINAFF